MTDSLIAIVVLFVIAGGGIILIDALVLRRIRNQPKADQEQPAQISKPEPTEAADDVSPDS